MSLNLITAPATDPVTTTELWNHLRLNLSGSPEQPTAREMASAAVALTTAIQYLDASDGILNRCLMPQTWDLVLDNFPGSEEIAIPLAPVSSITHIKYTDTDGVEQTFSDASYALSLERNWQPSVILGFGLSWPSTRDVREAVRVRFVSGYADVSSIPGPLRQALLLLAGHYFEHREDVVIGTIATDLPMGVASLISPYKNRAI